MAKKGIRRASQGGSGADEAGLSKTDVFDVTFRGNYEHSLDSKGRVSVPVSFREVLKNSGEETVVLTNFITEGARCLDAYALSAWRRLEEGLKKKSRFGERIRSLEQFYFARAAICTLDASGRITIPAYLRNYAGLDRDVVFSASLHGFRLWDARVSELVFRQAEAALLDDPSMFVDLDLSEQ